MKRKKGAFLAGAVLLASVFFGGCGSDPATNRTLGVMNVDRYVTLGDYDSFSVSVTQSGVEDAQVEELLLALYHRYVTADNGGITDRPVEAGDTVVMDYEGKRDGVAFQGGTASGAELTIGSGRFIPGFEEGLMGVVPGETVELPLTFPENYDNGDLAGAEVVFTVTVNYILPRAEEMQDSVVALLELEEAGTVEELRQYVRGYLEEIARAEYQFSLQNAILDQLVESSSFEELPEGFLESYQEMVSGSLEKAASDNGVTPDVFTNYYYNMSSQEYVSSSAQLQAMQELAMQAVANRENLTVDDEELQEKLEQYAQTSGRGSVEALLEEFDREEYRNYFMCEKVLDFLIEKTDVTEADEME